MVFSKKKNKNKKKNL